MIGAARQMLTCHWSARRIQRYLDADPGAPLTPGEVSRLEVHLATCAKCVRVVDEYRVLHRALARLMGTTVDPAAVDRVHTFLDTLTVKDHP